MAPTRHQRLITWLLFCMMLFLTFNSHAQDQIYFSSRPTTQMTKLVTKDSNQLYVKYFNTSGHNDNVIHFIPDDPSAKTSINVNFYVEGLPPVAWAGIVAVATGTPLTFGKCGLLVESSLVSSKRSSRSYNSTVFNTFLVVGSEDKFECQVTVDLGTNGLFKLKATPKSNHVEGVYMFELNPNLVFSMLSLFTDQTPLFQTELVVYSKSTLTKLGKSGVDPNSLVDIKVAPPSVIDPTDPPSLDTDTFAPFIPLRDNFGMNVIVSSTLSGQQRQNLIYTWQVMRVYEKNTAIIDILPKTNFLGKSNTLQSMYQQNSLGYSSLVLSQDKMLYTGTTYKVVASVYTSGKSLIARKIKYLKTPLDFSPFLGTGPVGLVSPIDGNFTQPFTFKVMASTFMYSDLSYATNIQYAFGYVDPSLIKGGLNLNNFENIPYSTLLQACMRVTPFSISKTVLSFLPPSYALGENVKTWRPVLFVKDITSGNMKTFLLSAVTVRPVSLLEIYKFISLPGFTNVSMTQLKGLVGITRNAYSNANSSLVELVQRRLFSVIQSNLEGMTLIETGKLADIARILEMWTYNGKETIANIVATDGDTVFTQMSNFFSMVKSDANNNKYTGDVTAALPLGMRDSSVLDVLASTLSSLMQVSKFKSKAPALVRMFSTSIVDSISPSEERRYSTDTLIFSIRKDFGSNFNGTVLTGDSSYHSIVMPTVSTFNQSGGLYGTEFVTYLENPNPSTTVNGNITSEVISLRCINPSGDYFPLSGLTDPIILNFNISKVNISNPDLIVCKYWNETESDWKSDGCSRTGLVSYSDYYMVECSCDHTTQFATFVEFPTIPVNLTATQKQAYYILWGFDIGIGVIFVIISLVMLLLIVIFRNSQPVKAKYIAPFVGMTSIFLESLLSYVVKSSLMIGFTATNSSNISFYLNTITYCSATIISVAFCVTVLTFVIQTVRYHLMRRMYSIMSRVNSDNEKETRKKISFYRFISSRSLYIFSVVLIALTVFTYFTGFSIGRIIQENITSDTSKQTFSSSTYTIVTSSFMGAILLLSLISVSLIFITDMIYAFAVEYKKPYVDSSDESGNLVEMSESSQSVESTTSSSSKKKFKDVESLKKVKDITISSMYKFFVQDDPLFFRCESLLFIFCLTVLLISYVFGIVGLGFFTLTGKTLSTSETEFEISLIMEIVRLVLSVVYFFLYILVFGDLSLLIYIFKYRKYRMASTSSSSSSESFYDNELQEILNDGLAYKLFEKFTVKEFSKENLLCYNSLQELEDEKQFYQQDVDEQVKMLENIIDKYLTQTSSFEVNIPSNTRKNLINLVKSKEGLTKEKIHKSLESLKSDILVNLTDTFSRFSSSQGYEFWTQVKEEKERLLARNKMA